MEMMNKIPFSFFGLNGIPCFEIKFDEFNEITGNSILFHLFKKDIPFKA